MAHQRYLGADARGRLRLIAGACRLETAFGLQERKNLSSPLGIIATQSGAQPGLDLVLGIAPQQEWKKIAEGAEALQWHRMKQDPLSCQDPQRKFQVADRNRR